MLEFSSTDVIYTILSPYPKFRQRHHKTVESKKTKGLASIPTFLNMALKNDTIRKPTTNNVK